MPIGSPFSSYKLRLHLPMTITNTLSLYKKLLDITHTHFLLERKWVWSRILTSTHQVRVIVRFKFNRVNSGPRSIVLFVTLVEEVFKVVYRLQIDG